MGTIDASTQAGELARRHQKACPDLDRLPVMEMPVKLAMAQVIARKIVENPGLFHRDLIDWSAAFIENGNTWAALSGHWENSSPAWGEIAKQLPEILEKLARNE